MQSRQAQMLADGLLWISTKSLGSFLEIVAQVKIPVVDSRKSGYRINFDDFAFEFCDKH